MNEYTIPALLCEYLNSIETIETIFVPETLREGSATVFLSGEETTLREYINGSSVVSVPFEIRLRCGSSSVRERLDAVDFFTRIKAYAENNPVHITENEDGQIISTGGIFKSAVFENGDEEYRGAFSFRYMKKA